MPTKIDFATSVPDLSFEDLSYEDKLRSVEEGWSFVLGDKPEHPENMKGILFRPKQRKIFYAPHKYPAYIGAFRSGKSLILCIKALYIATKYPGTRVVLIRETYPQLMNTTISTLIKMFNYFGWRPKKNYDFISTKKKFILKTTPLESEIMFLAARAEGETLEDAIANFQSFEADWIGVDEAPGIDERLYLVLQGRTGQWGIVTDERDKQLMITGNPPTQEHYLFKRYVQHTLMDGTPLINPEDYFLVRASTYENKANLSPDYIRQLEAYPPFWRKTFLEGEWGFLPPDGFPVFGDFKMDLYASKGELKYHPDRPMLRGWDIGPSGRWKACVIGQLDPKGVLLVLHEVLSDAPGIENFGRLVQHECRLRFPKCHEYRDFTDPAAFDFSQTDLRSPALILSGIGIRLAPGEKEFRVRNEAVVQLMSRLLDGSPGIYIDAIHCVKLLQGFAGGYRYSIIGDPSSGRTSQSVVKDIFSHCLSADAKILCSQGERRIADIAVGDFVITPYGIKTVTATMNQDFEGNVVTIELSNGRQLICTDNHPIFTARGIVRSDTLRYNDSLIWADHQNILSKYLTALDTIVNLQDITSLISMGMVADICTELYGNITMEQSQQVFMSIILMAIRLTTGLRTLNYRQPLNIPLFMPQRTTVTIQNEQVEVSLLQEKRLEYGMDQKKEGSGTANTQENNGRNLTKNDSSVLYADNLILATYRQESEDFVPQIVWQKQEDYPAQMILQESVQSVLKNLESIDTPKQKPVPKIVDVSIEKKQMRVYDLTVEQDHCFFAEGVLVGNCQDALAYMCSRLITIDKAQKDEMLAKIRARMGAYSKKMGTSLRR